MQPEQPTLTRALLHGSLWHFLTAFVIPILLIGGGIGLRLARSGGQFDRAEILVVVGSCSAVLGAIFLFHEVVLLVAVAVQRWRRRLSQPTTDQAAKLLSTVFGADLIALLMLFLAAAMKWQPDEMREVLPFFLLPAVGFYGVYLFGCCVRDALPSPPAPPGSPTIDADPHRAGAPFSDRRMTGLQVYATAAAAWLAWGAFGWPQDWLRAFGKAAREYSRRAFGGTDRGRVEA